MIRIPHVDVRHRFAATKAEMFARWSEIVDSGVFVGGPHVAALEREFAALCGVEHCAVVSDGTAALRLALRARGVGPGDEVILPANTFVATAEAVSHTGARPVLVDCEPRTFCLDPARLEAAITGRTVGIIGVHLYGHPADLDAITAVARGRGLWTMEDAAQAHLAGLRGRRVGSLGDCATFSFYPTKNLGAPGEGGAVVSADAALVAEVRALRDHGASEKYRHRVIGENARLPALMAAALRTQIPWLERWTATRRRLAARYLAGLASCPHLRLPVVADGADPVWHLFVVHVPERDAVRAGLERLGIGCAMHYPVPIHLQAAYAFLEQGPGRFPHAEDNAAHCLSLPMYENLEEAQVDEVCAALRRVVEDVEAQRTRTK